MESLATPQEAVLEDEQIRILLASPGTCRSEKQVRNDHKFISQVRLKV